MTDWEAELLKEVDPEFHLHNLHENTLVGLERISNRMGILEQQQAADAVRFEALNKRLEDTKTDVNKRIDDVNVRLDKMDDKVSDIQSGVGETVGMLRKMNGFSHDTKLVDESSKIVPMPKDGTFAYYLVLFLYWGGIPAAVIMGIVGVIWTLNQMGII